MVVYHCTHCPRYFTKKINFLQHTIAHQSSFQFQGGWKCRECGYHFLSEHELESHFNLPYHKEKVGLKRKRSKLFFISYR